jgi:hypothetical protein
VARIPLSVTDAQFRQYFEQFGQVQVRSYAFALVLETCLVLCFVHVLEEHASSQERLP